MRLNEAPELKGWMLLTAAADALGMSRQNVHLMAAAGKFESLHYLPGAKPLYVVSTEEVEALKAAREAREVSSSERAG